jgi:hypothetical protein
MNRVCINGAEIKILFFQGGDKRVFGVLLSIPAHCIANAKGWLAGKGNLGATANDRMSVRKWMCRRQGES